MFPDKYRKGRRALQGFAADPDYWKGEVFAYVGLPQNLKDLKAADPVYGRAKCLPMLGAFQI